MSMHLKPSQNAMTFCGLNENNTPIETTLNYSEATCASCCRIERARTRARGEEIKPTHYQRRSADTLTACGLSLGGFDCSTESTDERAEVTCPECLRVESAIDAHAADPPRLVHAVVAGSKLTACGLDSISRKGVTVHLSASPRLVTCPECLVAERAKQDRPEFPPMTDEQFDTVIRLFALTWCALGFKSKAVREILTRCKTIKPANVDRMVDGYRALRAMVRK